MVRHTPRQIKNTKKNGNGDRWGGSTVQKWSEDYIFLFFRKEGRGIYNKKKLKKEIYNKIDKTIASEIEKADRYLKLVSLFHSLDDYIDEFGEMVVIQNGAQTFLKPNPAIQEKLKINSQILALERSFFDPKQPETKSKGGDLL